MGVIIRQSLKGTLANYIGIAVGFFTTFFILTKYLTAEEIGLTRILVDAGVLLSGLAQLGTNSSAIRYYPYFKDEGRKDHGFFGWTLIVPLVGFAIYALLFLCFKEQVVRWYAPKSQLFVHYLYVVLPIALFMLYQAVFEVNANVLMRIAVPKFVREVGVRLMTLACYLLYAFHVLDLDRFVIAFCLVYAVAMLCDLLYLLSLKKISFKPDLKFVPKKLRKDFLWYTLFMMAAALAGNLMPVLNTFFVGAKMGLMTTGVFAIAMYIAAVIEVPYRSLGAIAQPEISQAVKENDIAKANRLCRSVSLHQLLAGSFIFFIIWINIDLLFQLIPNGDKYADGKWVVLILGMARLMNSTLSVGCTVLNYSKYYAYSLLFTFLLTASAVFLNVKLIPVWGMCGAAAASLISYSVYFLLLLFVVWRSIRVHPFSGAQWKVVAVMAILLLLDFVWVYYLTPLFGVEASKSAFFGESVLRTVLLCALGTAIVYLFRVSDEVNRLIDKYLLHRRRD